VLVADDEPVVRDVVRRMAESCGYHVLLAADAQATLELARSHGPRLDAVVLDLNMPGMEDALPARLRAAAPDARMLIITGDWTVATPVPAADQLLRKPFSTAELDAALAHPCPEVL
jgi:CheY-like chemotaxis protein